jgi:hypothetical protein
MTRWALLAGAAFLLLLLTALFLSPHVDRLADPPAPEGNSDRPVLRPEREDPPSPSPPPDPPIITAPRPPVREPEWQDLITRLEELKDGDYDRAAEVIKDLAVYLDFHRATLDTAFADLAFLESDSRVFAASALATALGRIPDEATALRLLGRIEVPGHTRLKVAILYALGQDRYNVDRSQGTWGMSTGMAEIGATLEPSVAEKLVAIAWVPPGRPGAEMYLYEFPNALFAVLANSQGQEPVRRLFAKFAALLEEGYRLELAESVAGGLAQATDDGSRELIRRLAGSEVPEVRDAFSRAAMMRGDVEMADGLLRKVVDPDTPAEERDEVTGRLSFIQTKDAAFWARVEAVVLDFLGHDDRPSDQRVALSLANGLSLHARDPGRIADAVLRLALREESDVEMREAAVACFQPVGTERVRMRKAFETLVFDEKAPVSVRARAVNAIWEWTAEPDRPALVEDFRKRLPAEVVTRSHYLR